MELVVLVEWLRFDIVPRFGVQQRLGMDHGSDCESAKLEDYLSTLGTETLCLLRTTICQTWWRDSIDPC